MSKTCLTKRTVEIIYKILPTEYVHVEEMTERLKEYNINMSREGVRGVLRKLVEINLVKGKKGYGYKRIADANADISSVITNGTHIEKHHPDRAKRIYHEVRLLMEVSAAHGRYVSSTQIKKRVDAKSVEVMWAIRKLHREGLITPKKSNGYTWVGPMKVHEPKVDPKQMSIDVPPEEAKKMIEEMDNAKPGTVVPVENHQELPFPFNYKILDEVNGAYKLSLTPPQLTHERKGGAPEEDLSRVVITDRYGREVDRISGTFIQVVYTDLTQTRRWNFGVEGWEPEEKGKEDEKGFFARLFGF